MLMRLNELQDELAQHAQAIRQLGKRAVSDIIEIGGHLIQARDLCAHGG